MSPTLVPMIQGLVDSARASLIQAEIDQTVEGGYRVIEEVALSVAASRELWRVLRWHMEIGMEAAELAPAVDRYLELCEATLGNCNRLALLFKDLEAGGIRLNQSLFKTTWAEAKKIRSTFVAIRGWLQTPPPEIDPDRLAGASQGPFKTIQEVLTEITTEQ